MSILFEILKILGALGIFIYGMKLMSDGIQKVAGPQLRKIFSGMTSNRFSGVLTGFGATALIQSSSATTVMVVSFVNAGLLTLTQAIGVVMGANIGTTSTAWLISYGGFGNVDIVFYALIIIGITFPMLFVKITRLRNFAEFIMGFGILFIGLNFLKNSVPDFNSVAKAIASGDIADNSLISILEWVGSMGELGIWSIFLFIIIGTLMTVIVQSSSATIAITLTLLAQGWIDFNIAAAMVLGENIGTTITANLEALIGNVHAKRAARFHTVFNLIGVAWVLILFIPFINGIDWLQQKIFFNDMSILEEKDPTRNMAFANTMALSLFHTAFNIANTLALFFLIPSLARLIVGITPSKGAEDEEFHLQYISGGIMSTPELSLEQARKEVFSFAKVVRKMSGNVMMLLFKEPKNIEKLISKIKMREGITDEFELEIGRYLAKLGEAKLTEQSAKSIRNYLRILNELERMGDIFYHLSLNKERMIAQKFKFPEDVKLELEAYFEVIYTAIKSMTQVLEEDDPEIDMEKIYEQEGKINKLRDDLKLKHFQRIEKNIYGVLEGIMFLDFVNSAEKLGDHIVNIYESIVGKK